MQNTHQTVVDFSFVIPVYNEEDVLPLLFERMDAILHQLNGPGEVILVNDGSTDLSYEILNGKCADPRYRLVDLSRNFGHQIAITAGIETARGKAIVILDADLQDPPEVALEMIAKWREGFDVVAAQRETRKGETWFKRASANLYYRLLAKMSPVDLPRDVGDFRLIDRKVADALKAMPEQDRYFRGMVSWVGFRQTQILYERQERAAGETKYKLSAMFRLAANGILGFSDIPLRIALWFGLTVSLVSFTATIFVFLGWFFGGYVVAGWTSTVLLLSFLSGVQLLTLGVVGLYVGRIYNEAKARPLYLVNNSPRIETIEDVQPVPPELRPARAEKENQSDV
ncbi:glycosyltransferase family 2 protein [Aliiroseovarius sp. KMU-50]|uniref:Glycosyltransferase family 2 protein n=1 Tax=Aliiroseovarius salicola TaxID=3009082 RepID=A0ABT4W5I2_9RHOB|nr:glycosyltransferase family 2 protein [Aliiroseovarius sp. KMU-50]MDA5095735.1 glycosyltransferase family 2 protein [Aliiroseovarius sp. KMU-50]